MKEQFELINVGVTCGCGDKFQINGKEIICPNCHSKETVIEKNHIVIWD